MILVVGGTGTLGSDVTRRLLADGHAVRVATRTPTKAATLASTGADIVHADLRDAASLAAACRGIEVVVAAAHSMMGRGREASLHVDGDGHRRLIDAAREQGVRHIVYVSVYAGDPAFTAVPFFRIKAGVERHLQASDVSFTVLRPTAFMDFHAHVLIGEPLMAGKRVVVLGQGTRPRNLVAATDVAQIIIQAVADRSLINQTIDVGGPENLTTMEIVRRYEDALGRKARVAHVPIGLVRAAATLLGPVHAGLGQVLQIAAITDRIGQPFDTAALAPRLGLRLTRLDDWIAHRLGSPSR